MIKNGSGHLFGEVEGGGGVGLADDQPGAEGDVDVVGELDPVGIADRNPFHPGGFDPGHDVDREFLEGNHPDGAVGISQKPDLDILLVFLDLDLAEEEGDAHPHLEPVQEARGLGIIPKGNVVDQGGVLGIGEAVSDLVRPEKAWFRGERDVIGRGAGSG